MNILSIKHLNTIRVWLKNTKNFLKAFLLLKDLAFMLITGGKSKIREWFNPKKRSVENFLIALPVLLLIYFIPYTFMLENKQKTIIGILLQILTGAILVFEQISSNRRIRKQVIKIIQTPTLLALLITMILLPFAISIFVSLSDAEYDKWSVASGIAFFTMITYVMFLSSLTFLGKIKWLRSKNYIPGEKDKFNISNLSLRNVGILLTLSALIAIALGYLLPKYSSNNELLIQMTLIFFTFFYGFLIFPLLIISPLYFLAFIFAKFTLYIRITRNIGALFWIFLFILWSWGGLLLIMKEFR